MNTENKNSNDNKGQSGNRRRRNYRRGGNRNNTKKAADGQNSNNINNGANKKSSNKRRNTNRRRNYNKGTKLTGLDYISTKYINLLEQHLAARKKYFENFDRVNEQTKSKLERNFIESQKAFLDFKDRLKVEDRKLYEQRYDGLSLDTTYSANHDIKDIDQDIPKSEVPNEPHYLVSQQSANFANDTEESVGTIDDYNSYKGN